jgi:hypothetical protein
MLILEYHNYMDVTNCYYILHMKEQDNYYLYSKDSDNNL